MSNPIDNYHNSRLTLPCNEVERLCRFLSLNICFHLRGFYTRLLQIQLGLMKIVFSVRPHRCGHSLIICGFCRRVYLDPQSHHSFGAWEVSLETSKFFSPRRGKIMDFSFTLGLEHLLHISPFYEDRELPKRNVTDTSSFMTVGKVWCL